MYEPVDLSSVLEQDFLILLAGRDLHQLRQGDNRLKVRIVLVLLDLVVGVVAILLGRGFGAAAEEGRASAGELEARVAGLAEAEAGARSLRGRARAWAHPRVSSR